MKYNLYVNGELKASDIETLPYKVEGLELDTEYQFQLAGVNEVGEGELSPATTYKTPAAPIVKPSAPKKAREVEVTENTIQVETDSVEGADSYNAYLDGAQVEDGLSIPIYTFSALEADTAYAIQFTAVNTAGESNKSVTSTITTSPVTTGEE